MKKTTRPNYRRLSQLFILWFLFGFRAYASEPELNQLLTEGLKSNIVLQQKSIELSKALNALQDAEKLFLPTANVNAGYLTGAGGRYIDLPIGDLLNPVYGTLNRLTSSSSFPQIENVKTTFFPQDQYDIHLRTSMPLVNPDLYYNKDIQQQQVKLKTYEVDIYKRELVKNIKVAYYNYLSALAAVKAYESASSLVAKNLETSQSLLRNGKTVPAVIARIKAELERVEAQLIETKNQEDNAKRYINFLLNRDLNQEIKVSESAEVSLKNLTASRTVGGVAVNGREELKQLELATAINKNVVAMNSKFWYPRLNTFIDLGNQSANGFRVDKNSPYFLFGVNMDIPVWNWNRNKLKIARAQLDVDFATLNQSQTTQALTLNAQIAETNLKTAQRNFVAAERQYQSSVTYFELIEKGYKEGTNSLIEFLDARNQITAASTNLNVARFKILQADAILERETAAYPINQLN